MREYVYTQVDFLGPILGKTAFDIMLERSDPYNFSYQNKDIPDPRMFLEINNEKQDISGLGSVKAYEKYFESVFNSSLLADKAIPDIFLKRNFLEQDEQYYGKRISERKVIYKPDLPSVDKGVYGTNNSFIIKIKLMVSAAGNVKIAEPVNTSGFPEIDMMAIKYSRGWMFEPAREVYADDEWIEKDVVIKTEPTSYD